VITDSTGNVPASSIRTTSAKSPGNALREPRMSSSLRTNSFVSYSTGAFA
jgi:hypothetical protein